MTDEELRRRWFHLLFGIRKSIRYHTYRRAFFDRIHFGYTFIALVASSAAVAVLLKGSASGQGATGSPDAATWLAAAVSIVSAINLVARPWERARVHHDFVRRFTEVEQDMLALQNPTAEDLTRMANRRLAIEAEEPPTKIFLDAICHNEVIRAMGLDQGDVVTIGPWGRLVAHFTNVGSSSLDKAKRLTTTPAHP